jgi:mRNA-degrading endonuclease toxin of MazEF toxin-antitoxin module
MHTARFSGSFIIAKTQENGLDEDSVALTHQIRAIDKKRVLSPRGKLSHTDLNRLHAEVFGLLP